MHVLYFHQYFTTPKGSAGLRSYQMARRLVQRGHRVTMVCGSRQRSDTGIDTPSARGVKRGRVDGIDVVEVCIPYSNYDSLVRRSMIFFLLALRNIEIAAKTDFDLLFASSTPLTAGIPGLAMRLFKPRKPFVFEVRDLWPELPVAMGVVKNSLLIKALEWLEKTIYEASDALIALSTGMREGIEKKLSGEKPLVVIPNGCDLEICRADRYRQSTFLAELCPKAAGARLKAVFTGAHGRANGLHALIDAAKVLKDKGRSDIYIFLVGDGQMKPGLRRQARRAGLENVVFVDYLPKSRLMELMDTMDAGLMILLNVPAFYNGTSPNKFFDYIAKGLPVVNNYPGWIAKTLHDWDCGIAVPPDRPVALAQALIDLADSPDSRRHMGRQARRLAEKEFRRDDLADRFVDFLERIEWKSSFTS